MPPHASIIHCGVFFFFFSGFLRVPVNIKNPGAADRPDVLHCSHLTDLSGIEPVPPPRLTLTLCLATFARQL